MSEYANCPQCGSATATKVSFSWWGGAVGPALLKHVKCGQCGAKYNGKTGKSNTVGIVIYFIVVTIVALVAFVGVRLLLNS